LKIVYPHQAPKSIFTVIDERVQNAQPDFDQHIDEVEAKII
jgi:hypothetical protein